jgi:hypothetical protein
MPRLGWSTYGNNIQRDVELLIADEKGQRTLRYRPIDGRSERLALVQMKADAPAVSACLALHQRY